MNINKLLSMGLKINYKKEKKIVHVIREEVEEEEGGRM